jgi:hypothetical protein
MRVEVKYSGVDDRVVKVKEAEANGLRMSSDTFDDPGWQHGDPIIGTMIFTDEPTITAAPVVPRDLAAEMDSLTARVATLEVKAIR